MMWKKKVQKDINNRACLYHNSCQEKLDAGQSFAVKKCRAKCWNKSNSYQSQSFRELALLRLKSSDKIFKSNLSKIQWFKN